MSKFKLLIIIPILVIIGCASMGDPETSCGTGYKKPGCDPNNPYSTPSKTSPLK